MSLALFALSSGFTARPMVDLSKTFRRAEFWSSDTATLYDVLNVVGRWETASEWSERTEFAEGVSQKDDTEAQAATAQRAETAKRLGTVERVAFQQNIPKLAFTNEALAASVGKSVDDFATPPSLEAINLVYDALAQSKSSLVPPAVADERRSAWTTASGEFDAGAFQGGLAKGQALVLWAQLTLYFFYSVGALTALRVVTDVAGGKTNW